MRNTFITQLSIILWVPQIWHLIFFQFDASAILWNAYFIFQLNMSIVLERKIMNQSSITESMFLCCLRSLPTCMQPPLIWFVLSVEHGQLCKSWHWIWCHMHRAKKLLKHLARPPVIIRWHVWTPKKQKVWTPVMKKKNL